MKIGLISTINTNIGDDFIREGIVKIAHQAFGTQDIQFVTVNKHFPLTLYRRWHPRRLASYCRRLPIASRIAAPVLERLGERLTPSHYDTYFDDCNLIIQCGAPVIWPDCGRTTEWADVLWHQVIGRLYTRIPVLNLAAGSCYPWEAQPTKVEVADDINYLKAIARYCRVTTVRDELAKQLFDSIGVKTSMIRCSALLAADDVLPWVSDRKVVLINYMSGGGHYDWGQAISVSDWFNTVKTLVNRLKKRYAVVFLCHNEVEYRLAHKVDASLTRLWPKSPNEYFHLVSQAAVGLCNRMHASVGLAGLGIPSVAVCTDSRLLMVKALGLPTIYVKEASVDFIEDHLENLMHHRSAERERLQVLKIKTMEDYAAVVSRFSE